MPPPPLYTDNKLNPVPGFTVPDDHFKRFDILRRSVGTDPSLALTTRRGTGYYKVPSLKRRLVSGPVRTQRLGGHARRLVRSGADCVMTSCRPAGRDMECRRGRSRDTSSGWTLSAEDKRALIAFLKTL